MSIIKTKNSIHHRCNIPMCDGIRYKELGNKTLCEADKAYRKAILSYKKPKS